MIAGVPFDNVADDGSPTAQGISGEEKKEMDVKGRSTSSILTLKSGLRFAAHTEELIRKVYEILAREHRSDEEVRRLFVSLAADEEGHKKKILDLMEVIQDVGADKGHDKNFIFLRSTLLGSLLQEGPEPLLGKARIMKSKKEAIRWSLELEKAGLLFYYAMQDIVGRNETWNVIMLGEKKHVVKLMGLIERDARP